MKSKSLEYIGKKFGRLLVLDIQYGYGDGFSRAKCICDCGTEITLKTHKVSWGDYKSCGCLVKEWRASKDKAGNLKHGYATHKKGRTLRIPEYVAWMSMKRRCLSPTSQHYHRYGGRGIKVAQEWLEDFPKFLEDVGMKPDPSLTLERIDNEGNYEPGNCMWATRKQQANNRTKTPKPRRRKGEI